MEVALDVIARGARSTSDDALVDAVLARVAEKIRGADLDGGASAIDTALADLDAGYRRSRIALLEEGVKVDTLRRDAVAVARRMEMIVAVDQPTDRPVWSRGFRTRFDQACEDGEAKGVNFSLSVAVELTRRMVATGRDAGERGDALNLLGIALFRLGEREAGTARLEAAVSAYQAALGEHTRDRAPLHWAMTRHNLGAALRALGEREEGTARLEEAAAAYQAALGEWTRERMPFLWAQVMENVALTESAWGEKTDEQGRFRAALAACDAALEEYRRAEAAFYIEKATRLRRQLSSKLAAAP